MSPSPEKPCATIQCERTTCATAKWKRAGGQPIEGRYCEECAEKLERSGDEVVWDDGLDRSGDVVELRPDQVEDRWPVVTLMKPPGSRNLRFAPMSAPPGWERANATISCRYYPADHPGVLSPDEARLLARFVTPPECISAAEVGACKEIARRLSTWAEGEGTKP
jgi:hypothetical protein